MRSRQRQHLCDGGGDQGGRAGIAAAVPRVPAKEKIRDGAAAGVAGPEHQGVGCDALGHC